MPAEISDSDRADLIFTFQQPFTPVLFDDDITHGMFDRMKKVDFIAHAPDQTWLIEVKDPESTLIPLHRKAAERDIFRKRMRSGTLYTRELAPKLKDTLIYLTLAHRAPTSRILYIVVIGLTKVSARTLLSAQNKLRALCYHPGPNQGDWASHFDVVVVNISGWNRYFAPHSVRRKP